MSDRTRELGKQAMDALEKAVLSALEDATTGECSKVGNCNGNDQHGPKCINNLTGFYTEETLANGISDVALRYLLSKGAVRKPKGYTFG